MIVTYIGLGSNLGDSRQILAEAVQKLATLGQVKPRNCIKVHPWTQGPAKLSECRCTVND